MTTQRRAQVIVVGGALAIASAAYGLGTQAGGGTAVADNNSDGERGGRMMVARGAPCGFEGLADELGVDEAKLEAAMRDFREQHADEARGGFVHDLAAALGISEDKVRAALGDARGELGFRFGPPLRGLARELGVTQAELRKALHEVGRHAPRRFEEHSDELAQFLADRLDIDVDKVRDALPKMGPPLGSPHPPGLPDHPPAL